MKKAKWIDITSKRDLINGQYVEFNIVTKQTRRYTICVGPIKGIGRVKKTLVLD